MFKQAGTSSHEPNLGAAYQAHLTDLLSDEHRLLLDGLDNCRQFLAQLRVNDFERELKLFKGRFHSHVMAENLKLYLYLKMSLPQGSTKKKYADDMRIKMKDIARQVNDFYAKFGNGQLTSALLVSCESELSELRKMLGQRFEEEERQLFPLYSKKQAA
jgi:regulator of sigma D